MSAEKLEPVINAIFYATSTYNRRAGEIIPLMGVQTKLGTRFRAEELNAAFEAMQERGWVEAAEGPFFKLTAEGMSQLGPLPTVEDAIRAILDAASTYNPRAGEIIPFMGVQTKLGTRFRAEELNAAFEAMQERGWVEAADGQFFKLTEAGAAEL